MIQLLRIVYEFYPIKGGSVTHIIELSKNINKNVDQRIIAPDFGEECKCKEFDNRFEVPIIRIKFKPIKGIFHIPVTPLNQLIYLFKVFLYLRKTKKFDLIQVHYMEAAAVCIMFKKIRGVPVVAMMHGADDAYSRLSGFQEAILAKLFKPDHAFILDDGSIAPEKFKKIWKNRVTVVYHGIDTNFFKAKPKNKELIEKSKLTESDFIILSTSSLIPVKNIDLAIKSFGIFLNKTKTNSCLLLAGEGTLKDELVKLAKEYSLEKNVKFLGGVSIDLITEYLSIADVVIATSLYSNLNRSVLEAMASGKPIVVFDSGGTSKLIRHMENGLLVKSGDIDYFAEQLKLLYENPELGKTLGKNARKTIIKERSWETRIKKELDVYEKIICEKNGK